MPIGLPDRGCIFAPPGEYDSTVRVRRPYVKLFLTTCYIYGRHRRRCRHSICSRQVAEGNALECGPMPNVMAALPNICGARCSTPQSLADAHARVLGVPQTTGPISAASGPKRQKVYSPRYNNTAVKTDSIKTQSGGLPERHKDHLSGPPIVTKKTITQHQFTAKCKVTGASSPYCGA